MVRFSKRQYIPTTSVLKRNYFLFHLYHKFYV
uniref:Uncharacterized protein n=1 Tax=Rhizophora mucronata TaxID=61149 RepID=A0A2P2PAL4_RHIMU